MNCLLFGWIYLTNHYIFSLHQNKAGGDLNFTSRIWIQITSNNTITQNVFIPASLWCCYGHACLHELPLSKLLLRDEWLPFLFIYAVCRQWPLRVCYQKNSSSAPSVSKCSPIPSPLHVDITSARPASRMCGAAAKSASAPPAREHSTPDLK